jgi:hypothetical protein
MPAHRPLFSFRVGGVLVVGLLLLVPTEPLRADTSLHPQDGPHVDLRLELRADAFTIEASMNLLFLDEAIDSGREQEDRIELSELRALRPALEARMAELCRVAIDGVVVPPRLEGLAKNDPDEALLPLFPRSGFRGLRKIRFELVYPLPSAGKGADPPRSIAIAWLLYPINTLSIEDPQPPLVLAAELVVEGVRSEVILRSDEPEFIWHRPAGGSGLDARLDAVPAPEAMRAAAPKSIWTIGAWSLLAVGAIGLLVGGRRRAAVPFVLVILGGGGIAWLRFSGAADPLPSEAEIEAIFRPLHANLYRAFDYAEDEAIYDALARSVDGPLLEDLFLSIHQSLVMQEEGGAVSRVRGLRERSLEIESVGHLSDGDSARPGFVVRYRYQVDGRVVHWGHAHDRTNEYLARYTVVAKPEGWRIAAAQVLEQARVDGLAEDGTFEL